MRGLEEGWAVMRGFEKRGGLSCGVWKRGVVCHKGFALEVVVDEGSKYVESE